VASAFSPAVASLWGAGEVDRIRSGFSRALRLVVFVAIAITGIAVAVGTSLIELVFGSAFADTRDVLVVLVLTLPFMPLAYLSTSMLRGIGRQWGLTIIGGAAAIANIALAFLLVPPYGAIGAALANTIAQVAYAVPLLLYALYSLGGISLRVPDILRGIVVGVAATAAGVTAVAVLPLAIGFVLGSLAFAAAFVGAGLVVRPLSGDDAAWLESILGSRVGSLIRLTARVATPSAPGTT
jgi:O-antigen/teichoic acid export membrane protein